MGGCSGLGRGRLSLPRRLGGARPGLCSVLPGDLGVSSPTVQVSPLEIWGARPGLCRVPPTNIWGSHLRTVMVSPSRRLGGARSEFCSVPLEI